MYSILSKLRLPECEDHEGEWVEYKKEYVDYISGTLACGGTFTCADYELQQIATKRLE